jgi:Phosphomannose isomerase type I, catalytic domain
MSKPWRDRIGDDSWRNLIADEAAAEVEDSALPFDQGAQAPPTPPTPPTLQHLRAHGQCCWQVFDDRLYGAEAAYVVHQAGRLFLLGAPDGVADRLAELCLKEPVLRPHCHVVLLSWDKQHTAGLPGLIDGWGNESLTLWTTSWLWAEIAENNSGLFDGFARLAPESAQATLLEAVKDSSHDVASLKGKVITGEHRLDLRLGAGLGLRLYYVPSRKPTGPDTPSRQPALAAAFRCNHLQIVINPLGWWWVPKQPEKPKDRSQEQTRKPSPEQTTEIEKLYQKVAEEVHNDAALRAALYQRYGDIRTHPDRYITTGPVAGNHFTKLDHKANLFIPSPRFLDEHPTFVRKDLNGAVAEAQFGPAISQPCSRVTAPQLNDNAPADPTNVKSTVFVLMCGAVGGTSGEVLTPARQLQIGNKGKAIFRPILLWHLERLNALIKKNLAAEKHPVLLVTSPETDAAVRNLIEVAKTNLQALDITVLYQPLIPSLKLGDDDKSFLPDPLPDGGWRLGASGHFDILECLNHWRESQKEKPRFCIAVNFNNVGNLYNDTTLRYLNAFGSGDSAAAVETFELALADEQWSDERVNQLSYVQHPEGDEQLFRLDKAAYGFDKPNPRQPGLRYSSNTWYFKIDKLRELTEINACRRYIFEPPPEKERRQFRARRDLDQLTHTGPATKIMEFTHKPAAKGFYASPRFVVVRTEEHLRSRDFRDQFDGWAQAEAEMFSPSTKREEELEVLRKRIFNVLSSVPQSNVWGGRRLCQNEEDPDTGEKWMGTHPAGTSLIYLDRHRAVPFTAIAPDEFDVMMKYLDCQGDLSIQVHPDQVTAADMSRSLIKVKVSLKDQKGKEETFFVVNRANSRPFHLFYGFERDALKPLAAKLRNILERYAADLAGKNEPDCYAKLVAEIRRHSAETIWPEIDRHLEGRWIRFGKDRAAPLPSVGVTAHFRRLKEQRLAGEGNADDTQLLRDVFAYHVARNQTSPPAEDKRLALEDKRLALLGHEYVFAAIAIVWLIRTIRENTWKEAWSEDERERIASLFQVGEPPSPLMHYFHKEVAETGRWGRVPPGTVHAWQGGGNFLIELSNSSDNTFRILDFGREIGTHTARGMHYDAAMFSLRPTTIVQTVRGNVFFEDRPRTNGAVTNGPANPDRPLQREVHRDLRPQRLQVQDGIIKLPSLPQAAWSMLLNPDNPMRIQAKNQGEQTVEIYGGAYINERKADEANKDGENPVTVIPTQDSDRIFRIVPRRTPESLAERIICVSLGSSKIETALIEEVECLGVRTGSAPPHSGQAITAARKAAEEQVKDLRDNADRISDGAGAGSKDQTDSNSRRQMRLVVSWPGYCDGKKYYSSVYGSYDKEELRKQWQLPGFGKPDIINDALLSALGESEHRLGLLHPDRPGMVLNIGSGICAGFYLPNWKVEDMVDPDVAACGALGRWLGFEKYKGTVGLFPDNGNDGSAAGTEDDSTRTARIRKLVFKERTERNLGQWERGSVWWETRALVSRACAISRLRNRPPEGASAIARVLQLNHGAIGEDGPTKARLRRFFMSIAAELAEIVQHAEEVLKMLQRLHPGRFPDAASATRHIVLTGTIGRLFGSLGEDDDILVDVMKANLGEGVAVYRSEIAHAAEREAAGFQAYLRRQRGDFQ